MRYHSIALHAILIFRPKCDVQVYILIFLSIRCYIKLICQLQVGSGGIVPIPIFFPNSVPIPSGSGLESRIIPQRHRDRNPDPDGIGTEYGKKIGIGTIPSDPILYPLKLIDFIMSFQRFTEI
jgi:hypothetical protein